MNKWKILPTLGCLILISGALVGCHKRAVGQVVAVVNGQEITIQELAAEAQSAGIEADLSQKPVIARLVQRVINRDILADYAKQAGLDRSPEYVLRRQQLEQSLLADLAARKIAGVSNYPTKPEIDAYVAAHPFAFAQRQKLTLDEVTFATPAKPEVLKFITSVASLDDVMAKLGAQGVKFTRRGAVMDTAATDPALVRQILALKNGEVFDLSSAGQTYIGVVVARNLANISPEAWPNIAANAIRAENLAKAVGSSVKSLRDKMKIEYNPEFKPVN